MKKWWLIIIALVVLAGLFWIGYRLSNYSPKQNGVDKTPVVIDDEKNGSDNGPVENSGNGQEEPDPEEEEPSDESAPEPGETDYSKYDNKKYAWYVLRKSDHSTPGTGAVMAELLKKYGGFYLGDTSRKVVYLTFDEGYEYGYTPVILDILRDNNVKAAFFITLPYLNKNPELVQRMVEEGHIVGNHTVSHPSLPDLDNQKVIDEIEGLSRAFQEKTGLEMKYLRPPKGEFSERTLKISSDLGYRNVFWSSAYDDWDVNKQKGAAYAYKMVMDNIHNGNVILLHAVSQSNTEALDTIIKDLKAQGYRFGTLDEIN